VLAVASSHDIEELRQADLIVASLDQIQLSVGDSATRTSNRTLLYSGRSPWTHHPQMGTGGKREGSSAFTFVNAF